MKKLQTAVKHVTNLYTFILPLSTFTFLLVLLLLLLSLAFHNSVTIIYTNTGVDFVRETVPAPVYEDIKQVLERQELHYTLVSSGVSSLVE